MNFRFIYNRWFVILALLILFISVDSNAQTGSETYENVNVIQAIGFEVNDGKGTVTVEADSPIVYEQVKVEPSKITLKLKNVILAQKFQISRDVTDYDSPISFISSFRDPVKEDDVLLVIDYKQDDGVEHEVLSDGKMLTLNFQREDQKKQVEGVVSQDTEPWAFDFTIASNPGIQKQYRGELVSFDFKDADIRDVLRILSDISGFNVVIASDVQGTVTLKLDNVPWDQALDVVLEDSGLGATLDGNVMKIATLQTLQARQRAFSSATQAKEAVEPLATKQVFINYAQASELETLIDPVLSNRGEIRIDTRTNSILITDIESKINQIEELAKSLDTRTPQVLIESRIVQATLDFTRELGVQWGFNFNASAATGNPTGLNFPSSVGIGGSGVGSGPGTTGDNFIIDLPAAAGTGAGGVLGIVLGSITGAYDLDIRLSALENRGDGRILSSPKVLTLDNTPARIEQGVSIPFLSVSAAGTQTQFVDATLRLEVTPQVTNDDRVIMNVRVTDNAPDATLTGAGGQPGITRNEAETQVIAGDGETIVIGGIFTRSVADSTASGPSSTP
ncbi:MAG: type IV pilus secretin PilQ, partial [Thermodesulfobacteriota bacterium]